MHPIVYFYPTGHEEHQEPGHPERPARIEALRRGLQAAGWWDPFPSLPPLEVSPEVLRGVHSPAYLQQLEMICWQGGRLDADTYTTPSSWEIALQSAGGALAVASQVWSGEARRGFALTRPPGHHALSERGMGFCLLNNIALAAEHLLQTQGARRLAIVDLDLHHGNGTQDIFWRRGDVFFLSIHQSPLYPGTGSLEEIGVGPGEGRTANFPLPPGSGDSAYRTLTHELILPLINQFAPQMLLVSFGFDPHWRDPLGHLRLSAYEYGQIISSLSTWADKNCGGKLALFLEGGYDLEAGEACGQAAVSAMLELPWNDPLGRSPHPEVMSWHAVLDHAREVWGL